MIRKRFFSALLKRLRLPASTIDPGRLVPYDSDRKRIFIWITLCWLNILLIRRMVRAGLIAPGKFKKVVKV